MFVLWLSPVFCQRIFHPYFLFVLSRFNGQLRLFVVKEWVKKRIILSLAIEKSCFKVLSVYLSNIRFLWTFGLTFTQMHRPPALRLRILFI